MRTRYVFLDRREAIWPKPFFFFFFFDLNLPTMLALGQASVILILREQKDKLSRQEK